MARKKKKKEEEVAVEKEEKEKTKEPTGEEEPFNKPGSSKPVGAY